MDEITPGVMDADSPTDETAVDGASAAPKFDPNQQNVPYTRFKEINDGYRQETARAAAAEAQVQAMREQMAQLQRQQADLQRTAGRRTLSPDEQKQYRDATEALDSLLQHHPTLQYLPQVLQAFPGVIQQNQALQQQLEAQQTAQREYFTARHTERLAELFQRAKLPQDRWQEVDENVTAIIGGSPQLLQGLRMGDSRVIDAAFNRLYGREMSAQNAQTLQTKAAMSRLPRAPMGGAPGAGALPKMQPGKEREYLAALHNAGGKMLNSGG